MRGSSWKGKEGRKKKRVKASNAFLACDPRPRFPFEAMVGDLMGFVVWWRCTHLACIPRETIYIYIYGMGL